MAQASEQELTNVTLALQRFPDIVLAAVFGSIIKGGATPDSDIDIAVLTKTPMISADRIALIEAITLATGRAVDLIDLRESGQPVLNEIVTHGKQIMGERSLWGDLIFRNVVDQEDFVPYQQRILEGRRKAWINS
ncbi:MAG: nucleotidyltransferase domain-containing protein [Marinobacter sp.]|uniref:type VII toxin-antitoxin system MntA family adenylyltransferase antitoxin n=1 Tax=Marinobacter sp. TaxID=50741 RepID=UPI0034A06C54